MTTIETRSKIRRRDDCRLCGSTALELVLQLTPTPLGDSYFPIEQANKTNETFPIDLFVCDDCGYAHLRDVVDPDEIYPEYIYLSESSPGLRQHFSRYATDAVGVTGLNAGELAVDIGSNDGMLLKAIKNCGLRVVGIDPAKAISTRATEEGVPTIAGYFSPTIAASILHEHGEASLITANNVFANLDDLESVMRGVSKLLAPDGVFIVEFAYVGDLIENMVFDYIYHEHLSYFSVTSLRNFFLRMGFEPFYLQKVPTKGGSIRLYNQKAGGKRRIDGVVAEILCEEELKGLTSPKRFRDFSKEVDLLRAESYRIMTNLTKDGRKFAGYGASVTSTTLIYHFRFGEFLKFLVDENPAKQGTNSPGLHLPVYSPEKLREPGINGVLILAWRFAEPILKKLQHTLATDIPILIPLPKPQLLKCGNEMKIDSL